MPRLVGIEDPQFFVSCRDDTGRRFASFDAVDEPSIEDLREKILSIHKESGTWTFEISRTSPRTATAKKPKIITLHITAKKETE